MKHLRNFGFGKKDLEVVIEREASNLVEYILANNNKEMKMEMFTFAVPVLNVLWDMVAGHAFKREDKELKRILDLMNFTFVSKLFATAMVMPWVRFIDNPFLRICDHPTQYLLGLGILLPWPDPFSLCLEFLVDMCLEPIQIFPGAF